MWAVSQDFLNALQFGHAKVTQCTYQVPGGSPVQFNIESGSVSADRTQAIRRSAQLQLTGASATFTAMRTPGTLFSIKHGIKFSGQTVYVPVFTGELQKGSQSFGGGTISVPLVDLSTWIARCDFLTPYSPTASTLRTDAIASIVTTARPGTVVQNLSSDRGTVGYHQVFDGARQDAINALTQDGMTEAFFGPDGTYIIRDIQSLASNAVWSTRRVLKSLDRTRDLDLTYNTVAIDRENPKKQKWKRQITQITDVTDPRHPNYIGVVPKFITSATAPDAASAMAIAQVVLSQAGGTPEQLSLDMVSNPALEAGDVIRIPATAAGDAQASIFQHYLDSFSMDLVTGDMSAATRSQGVIT